MADHGESLIGGIATVPYFSEYSVHLCITRTALQSSSKYMHFIFGT